MAAPPLAGNAESAWLAGVTAYLQAEPLDPAPATVGFVEPDGPGALPAVVLSLEASAAAGNGLGERSALVTGALPWQVVFDLASPPLAGDPPLVLDPTRTVLVLPHGGLVRRDARTGALGAADLTVKVAGAAVPLAAAPPGAGAVAVDPAVGRLVFGTPLPAAGTVEASYFLGQWEQRVARISGLLRADLCAAGADEAGKLSAAVLDALLAPRARTAIPGLIAIGVRSLGSIGTLEPAVALRRRTVRLSFVFESEINRPDSSGGVIARIPITTTLGPPAAGRPETTVVTAPS
jgi:hypothetical protein